MADVYMRYPDVHADQIVFVADNDLWLTSTKGGAARRITDDGAPVINPKFSPDGTRIAFTSAVAGGKDVYVRQPEGSIDRLTFVSDGLAKVTGWYDDDHVMFVSMHNTGQRGTAELHLVSLDGEVTPLPYGPVIGAAVSRRGALAVATCNTRDSAAWKRYRGGMAAKLWSDPKGGTAKRRAGQDRGDWGEVLPDEPAGKYAPGWVGERLIFSSDRGDHPAQGQLWSVNKSGKDLTQHTQHTVDDGYVRDPSTDGTQIVYHCRGSIHLMSSLKAKPVKLDIETGLGEPQPIRLDPSDRLSDPRPDHGANGSLVEWRGAAYFLTHRAGPARAVSDLPGVRIREPQLLGRTGKGIWASDAEGEDCLEIAAIDGTGDAERICHGELGRVLHLTSDPAGVRVAVVSHDGRVSLVEVASGTVRPVGRSPEGEATDPVFSPDGRYLVWRQAIGREGELGRLMIVETDGTDESVPLTRGVFNDFSPAFSADGKHLAFLSSRTLDPTYDDFAFDLGNTHSVRPWLAPLAADEPAPFGPSADGWAIAAVVDENAEDQPKKKEVTTATAEVAGFEDRIVAFPVPSDQYASLRATAKGIAWRKKVDRSGVLGSSRAGVEGEAPKDLVEHFSFDTRRTSTVVEAADSFAVSGDGERIVVRKGGDWWVQAADAKPGDDDTSKVTIDVARLRREIRPRDEWRQMFDENGRIMRDHYWRSDMEGQDWQAILDRYRPLVEKLRTHDDLVDMLWETVGELNTSHAYVMPPAPAGDQSAKVGRLGASLRRDGDAWVIEEILPGESSDPEARSPLRAAGVGADVGDRILAVDGRSVAEARTVGELLQGSVDRVVELTLERDGQARRVVVVPLESETALRYHAWVASRAAYVADHSGGRLGYVHVPDMMANGWAEFHRQIEIASRAEGVVVDVRFNGGGHTSQLILERLSRKVTGWCIARHYDSPMSYPDQAMRGPVVFVTNPYAGSDGDIVCGGAQTMGLGPVVGQRSWGGVVGIDGRFDLVDGTRITQPRYAHWFGQQGYGLENHGVDPDIEVNWSPADWKAETDSQLDRAIEEAFVLLEETPAATSPALEPPRWT
ncbi:S41 family peptidase [Parenemella sanctibonifatiensis]|uniref:Tricorn protease homolog n=1 Tax=Parenemella sanctibonifatiensis TaxID=2016505 RepID=A0A255EF49_9ACTN|nr:S41 family peptidase [Parenemella sanctibonifatiensis]OYN90176.1 peptidase S41 [Parenemella sanctibonifatiensis]